MESVFTGLLHTLDRSSISQLSNTLGESEQRVSRGMEASIASVLGGVVRKSDDFGTLRRMLDLVPEEAGEITWPMLAGSLTNPASPWSAARKNVVSAVFGSSTGTVANLVGRESGVGPETAESMLGIAAPMTLAYLRRLVHDEDLSMHGLSAVLHRESGAIRSVLPAGLSDLLWRPATAASAGAAPVAARTRRSEKSSTAWVGALGLALVALGSLWFWSHTHRAVQAPGTATTGMASRLAGEAGSLGGEPVKRRLPGGLEQAANAAESQLLGTMDSKDTTGRPLWVNFDRLKFASGSSTLPVDASAQLDQIAGVLKAHPNLYITIAGFTDGVESTTDDLTLSRSRADSVKSALVARAISPDRITTQGFGDQGALADNTTMEGRATNRRVSVRVTQQRTKTGESSAARALAHRR
jgi:outer membrane protein OmpA-like peptidoglycan-associated protein